MAIDLKNMNIAFNGQPFVELPSGSLDLLSMDVAYQGQPFVRQSGFIPLLAKKLLLLGSSSGSKLLLLGLGDKKLKIG